MGQQRRIKQARQVVKRSDGLAVKLEPHIIAHFGIQRGTRQMRRIFSVVESKLQRKLGIAKERKDKARKVSRATAIRDAPIRFVKSSVKLTGAKSVYGAVLQLPDGDRPIGLVYSEGKRGWCVRGDDVFSTSRVAAGERARELFALRGGR